MRTRSMAQQNAKPERESVGERGFLNCAEVLQHTLLPLLPASTLFRLSCTSRGLQRWLLQTPPNLWQDVPSRGVEPAFLATMPDTTAVLTALRKAHTARLAIEAGQTPVERQVVQLTTLSACIKGCSDGLGTACLNMAFSADGHFLALQFHSSGRRSSSPKQYEDNHGVAVLKVTQGFSEQACICSGPWYPTFSWAPAEPNLSIAIRGSEDGKSNACAQQPAVFVLDAKTGAALHALGPKNLSLFWQACFWGDPLTELEWDPAGGLLLVTRRSSWGTDAEQNLLSVFDVRQDMLLAQSTFIESPNVGCAKVIATWTPNSQGLVMSHGVQLQAQEAFAGQGLALGVLPEPCVLLRTSDTTASSPGAAFSPDGQRLLVCDAHDYWDEEHSSSNKPPPFFYHSIMQFQIEGMQILFCQESCLHGYGPFWLPCSSGLVVRGNKWQSTQHSKVISLEDGQHHEIVMAGRVIRPWFSPSRNLMASISNGSRIFSLQSGRQVWAHDTAKQQAEHFPFQWIYSECLAFLPSGCGVIRMGKVAGQPENVYGLHILLFA